MRHGYTLRELEIIKRNKKIREGIKAFLYVLPMAVLLAIGMYILLFLIAIVF